jgi:hypothetical protein
MLLQFGVDANRDIVLVIMLHAGPPIITLRALR